MKLLFITRTYPPLVGGMEKLASDFYQNYRMKGDVDLLANTRGKKMLPFFLIKVIWFLMLNSRNYDVIHVYDAILSPLVLVVRAFSNTKISFMVNGLDIVYSHFWYQKFMPIFLGKADRIFPISRHTLEQCALRGIPYEKLTFIPVGLDFTHVETFSDEKKKALMSKLTLPNKEMKILITVGRLVKRKGHAWFIEHVFKNLPHQYIYLIAGDGSERDSIVELVHKLGLADRVYMLGHVSDEEKNCLYQIADLFVMPNIHVENDQEGFGIVLLEAGKNSLPVIASNIEGIKDAVIEGQTGRLIEERNFQGFIDAIVNPGIDSATIENTVALNFDWKKISEDYRKEFEKIIAN